MFFFASFTDPCISKLSLCSPVHLDPVSLVGRLGQTIWSHLLFTVSLSLTCRQRCFEAWFGKLESCPLSETVCISYLPTRDQHDQSQVRAGMRAGVGSWGCWAGLHLSSEGSRVAQGRFLMDPSIVSPAGFCQAMGLQHSRAVRARWAASACSHCAKYPLVDSGACGWEWSSMACRSPVLLQMLKSANFQMHQSIFKCHQSRWAQGTFCATAP